MYITLVSDRDGNATYFLDRIAGKVLMIRFCARVLLDETDSSVLAPRFLGEHCSGEPPCRPRISGQWTGNGINGRKGKKLKAIKVFDVWHCHRGGHRNEWLLVSG